MVQHPTQHRQNSIMQILPKHKAHSLFALLSSKKEVVRDKSKCMLLAVLKGEADVFFILLQLSTYFIKKNSN